MTPTLADWTLYKPPVPASIVTIPLGRARHEVAVERDIVVAIVIGGHWHDAKLALTPDFRAALSEAYALMPSNT